VFAAVSYANAAPLAHLITQVCPDAQVIYDRPSALLEKLLNGQADAALIPVVDYFDSPDLDMIDGIGICADGQVESVLLKCHRPLAQVRTVGMDPASRTSNALARILLRDHFGLPVEMKRPQEGERMDAEVVIGDRALCGLPAAWGDYDLAEEWKTMTGLPFVFAVWGYLRGNPDEEDLKRITHAARTAGLEAIEELAADQAAKLGISTEHCLDYLTKSIRYDVGPRETEALNRFREMLTQQHDSSGCQAQDAKTSSAPPDRMSPAEALSLLRDADTAELMARADQRRVELHGRQTYFVHSLNLNPTNICENRCELCAFWREPDAEDAYVLSLDEARQRLLAARDWGLTDLHIVGGTTPDLDLVYYESLYRLAKEALPSALIQGLTAVEVHYLAETGEMTVAAVLERLKDAGLGAISGGGAEIFSAGVRERICSNKISAEQWLAVHEQAHQIGLVTNVTMLFGHVESAEDIVDHLARVRDLQDRTAGFRAFIPLPFHVEGSKLPVERGPGGHTVARVAAVARLFLDNVPHIRILANYLDRKLIQVLLHAGGDDIGGTSLKERIAKAAGAPDHHRFTSIEEMADFITDLDLEPVLVNSAYVPAQAGKASAFPVTPALQSDAVASALSRAESGERLTAEDAIALHDEAPYQELGRLAHRRRQQQVPGNTVTFVIDRNLSLTNVCESACKFCAFYVPPGSKDAFALSIDEVLTEILDAAERGATQVLIQGGLNPDLDLAFYEALLSRIKQNCDVWLHSLSAPEISYLSKRSDLSIRETLQRLIAAGLDSLPGGGAEILEDQVRQQVSPNKVSADGWFEVMETAHELGLRTTATMVYGLGETTAQRVEHLIRVRELQDRTNGFTAFIPWSFQPGRTQWPGRPATGADYLRVVVLARLVLDNVPHLQAGWVTEGPDLAQLALSFGADDFGGVLMEERVVRATGLSHTMTPQQVVSLIREAGFVPAQRTTQYEVLEVFPRRPTIGEAPPQSPLPEARRHM